MILRSQIKVNAAFLICLVFLFRILFVNVCLFTSLGSSQDNSPVNAHFSNILKKRRKADVQNKAAFEVSTAEVVCEENSGSEEDAAKVHSPAVLTWFHASLKAFTSALALIRPFDSIKCDLFPRRYLALSVIRV